MKSLHRLVTTSCRLHAAALLTASALLLPAVASHADTVASLLGNFTVNQFSAVTVSKQTVSVHYAVVYGQLPALRELHRADADGDGVTSPAERDAYVGGLAPGFAEQLQLTMDGVRVPLHAVHWSTSLPTEQGGFSLRADIDFEGSFAPSEPAVTRRFDFSNHNYSGQVGWHEIMVAAHGVALFDADAYASSATRGLTEALQSLPEGGPLDERHVRFSAAAALPAGSTPIGPRPDSTLPAPRAAEGTSAPPPAARDQSTWIEQKTRGLIETISAPTVAPQVALWTLLGALLLGAVHALSPGHGKTIVGAYLIGSRGTPRHAAFLGVTVTVTHTIGVFAVGFATLYASKFIVPEKLFPILSLLSALLVLGMGLVLLVQRVRAARGLKPATAVDTPVFFALASPHGGGTAGRGLMLAAPLAGAHVHNHADGTLHSHGGGPMHSHLPPGARGEGVTWKSLLALGISGGLVPCPSAMVLLLAAIALNKTAYGMLLVLVFSLGLAMTLTLVGLAFLYARNRVGRRTAGAARWPQLLPVLSAITITLLGIALCLGALRTFA